MSLNIKFTEIIEEITEDLELQAGFVLKGYQLRELTLKQNTHIKEKDLKPYVKDIKEYLVNTKPSERVWDCYQELSSGNYIIAIHIVTPYINLDTSDLNG